MKTNDPIAKGMLGAVLLNLIILPCSAQPSNDMFAARIVLTGTNLVATGHNIGATKEPGEPALSGGMDSAGGASVWWQWTAPSTDLVTIGTVGSGFDTLLGVYTGNSVAALTPIASNDDDPDQTHSYSKVIFNAVANQTYQIAVDGWSRMTGSVQLHLKVGVPEVVAWGNNDHDQLQIPFGLSDVTAIAAGEIHGLALGRDGRVTAWGEFYSRSYFGTRTSPAYVPLGLSNVVAISAGAYHDLALTAQGKVIAWGSSPNGQTNVPNGLSNVVQIAAGGTHNLALRADGYVIAWGGGLYGSTTATNVPPGLSNVVAIAAGGDTWGGHSLALTSEGRVFGWGGWSETPTLSNVVAIAAGYYHALALTTNGTVIAWGDNEYGQTDVPSGLSNVVRIAAGGDHSMAQTADGRLFIWGVNDFGEVNVPANLGSVIALAAGEGHVIALRRGPAVASPRPITAWGSNRFGQQNVPEGSSDFISAAAGAYHALGLSAAGRVSAWGYNAVWVDAGYGPGSSGWRQAGQATVPLGLSNVVGIAAGDYHSLALTAHGDVIAWGENYSDWYWYASGEVMGRTYCGQAKVPTGLSNVIAVAAGHLHSLALTADGRVVAWGYNGYSQTNVPASLGTVVAIAAAGDHSLALRSDGTVAAWGDIYSTPPIGLSNVVAIAAGYYHDLALKSDGTVVAWGSTYNDQANVPPGLSNIVAIATGSSHSLALTAEGRVVAWGANWYDQSTVPQTMSNVVAIAAGVSSSLAVTASPPAWVGPRYLLATEGLQFLHHILAGSGISTYAASGLPQGLIIDSATGVISGVPTQTGAFQILISVTSSQGVRTWAATLIVNQHPPPLIASGAIVVAFPGSNVSYRVTATYSPEWFGANGLPPGLSIDARSGVISGVAAAWGDFTVSLVASNRFGIGYGAMIIRSTAIAAWGINDYKQTDVPGISGMITAIAAGNYHCLALTADGRVRGWGRNNYYQTNTPYHLTNAIAIAGGGFHTVALTADGRALNSGFISDHQSERSYWLSNVIAIGAGAYHSLAVTTDGRVHGLSRYGYEDHGQFTPPLDLNNATRVAGGWYHSLALTAEGRVVAWGDNSGGQTNVPTSLRDVVAIAAGAYHSLALTANGRVVLWGYKGDGLGNIPAVLTNVVAIASGDYHCLALTADGRLISWGYQGDNRTQVPAGLSHIAAISAAGRHSLALVAPPLPLLAQPQPIKVNEGDSVTLTVVADTGSQLQCQWRLGAGPISEATNSTLHLTNVQEPQQGSYSVYVSDGYRSSLSSSALVEINQQPIANASATRPVFVSMDGRTARVVLDGTRTADPDGDALQFTWYQSGITGPLARGPVAVVELPLGTHALSLVSDDGMSSATNALVVHIVTAARAFEFLLTAVEAGAENSNPLLVTLAAALSSIDRSNPESAVNELLAFQNKIRSQVLPDDPELAAALLQSSQDIINALTGGNTNGGGHPKPELNSPRRHSGSRVQLEFTAAVGPIYLLEASTNLVDWEMIAVAAEQSEGNFRVEDVDAHRFPNRFYRVVTP